MKNIIKLYSIEIDLKGFLNLVKDSKFEPYRDKITKAINIKTFYLLDENTLFYLDSRNTLKKLKITQNDLKKEMATINIIEDEEKNYKKVLPNEFKEKFVDYEGKRFDDERLKELSQEKTPTILGRGE